MHCALGIHTTCRSQLRSIEMLQITYMYILFYLFYVYIRGLLSQAVCCTVICYMQMVFNSNDVSRFEQVFRIMFFIVSFVVSVYNIIYHCNRMHLKKERKCISVLSFLKKVQVSTYNNKSSSVKSYYMPIKSVFFI